MKRTFATLGVVGLGLISLTAPAMAASDQVVVCHRDGTTLTPLAFDVNGIGGHAQHSEDIIPPTPKLPGGMNWTNAGKILYVNECGAPLPPGEVIDPVVTPPVEQPPVVAPPAEQPPVVVDNPVVEQPVVQPPVVLDYPVVTPPVVVQPAAESPAAVAPAVAPAQPAPAKQVAAAPKAAPKAAPAAAPVSVGTNQGYNAQTAVGAPEAGPGWLAGLAALAAAGAAVAVRRRSRPLHIGG